MTEMIERSLISSSSIICSENEDLSSVPACHSTKPPKIEREADPDPTRASLESSVSSKFKSDALAKAALSAAYAEADEAKPAEVGT